MYTRVYYSVIKKNEIMPLAATQMDLDIIILSEVRQTKTNIVWYCVYVDSLKTKKRERERYRKTYIQNKPKDMENKYMVTKGEKQGG